MRAWLGAVLVAGAMAASPSAQAVTGVDCVLQFSGPIPYEIDVGVSDTFQVEIVEGSDADFCGSADIEINPAPQSDTSGGTTVDPPFNPTLSMPSLVTHDFTVNAGPNAGSAVFRVTCNAGCDFMGPNKYVDVQIDVVDPIQATIVSGDGQIAELSQAFPQPLIANFSTQNAGTPVSDTIIWSFDAAPPGTTFAGGASSVMGPTDGSGNATVSLVAGASAGRVTVRAEASSNPDAAAFFDLCVDALCGSDFFELTYNTPASGSATATIEPITLAVNVFENGGDPHPISNPVNFSIVSGPGGAFSDPNPLVSSGVASTDFTPSAEGDYVIRASFSGGGFKRSSGTTYDGPLELEFNIEVRKVRTLGSPSAAPTAGEAGQTSVLTVTAQDDGAAPGPSSTVYWQVVSGDASVSPTSSTADMSTGEATSTLTFGSTPGAVSVRAYRLDPIDGTTEVATQTFAPLEAFRYVLEVPAGSDQTPSGLTGSSVPIDALLKREGAATTNVDSATVHFQIISQPSGASSSLSPSNQNTAGGGLASSSLVADLPGTYIVRAEYPGGSPTTSVDYTVTLAAPVYALNVIDPAGGSVSAEVGVARTLTVELKQGTLPQSAETINWTTTSGTLGASSSNTNSSGLADVLFTPTGTGPATITAEFTAPAAGKASGPAPLSVDIVVTGFDRDMQFHAQPSGPNYTDETIDGAVVETFTTDGSTPTPEDNVAVQFDIISGIATFTGGATSANALSSGGFATSPTIDVGRGTGDIVVRATAAGRSTVDFTIPVTASSYSIRLDVSQNDPAQTLPNQATSVAIVVERTGSGTAVGLPGVDVDWTASGGNLSSPGTTTGTSGESSNQFSASTAGSYTVTASFDPAFGGLAVASVPVTVDVQAFVQSVSVVSGNNQSALAGQPFSQPLVAVAQDNGAVPASPVTINWSVSPAGAVTFDNAAPTTDPSTGQAQVVATVAAGATPGPVTITATRADSGTSATFSATVSAPVRTLTVVSGDNQSALAGDPLPLPLVVEAADNGAAPANPITINWSVSPAGAATVSSSSTATGSNGKSQVSVTLASVASPGTITISATRQDSGTTTVFNATVLPPVVRTLSKTDIDSGDGQRGLVGTSLPLPLRAVARDSGTLAGGVVVNWQVTGDATLSANRTSTGSNGETSVTVNLGSTAGSVTVTASRDDAPSATTSYVLTASTAMISVEAGNNQTGAPGTTLPQDFIARVALPSAGKSAAGVTVTWAVIDGAGSVSQASTVTDADGLARTRLTLGPDPGTNLVRASVAGGDSVDFSATALGPQLAIVAGNGQRGSIQTAGAQPLQVELRDAAGMPTVGTVQWQVVSGSAALGQSETVTDTSGRTSITFRYGDSAGIAVVRASADDGRSSVDFTLEATNVTFDGPTQGNDQSASPGEELAEDFVVTITPSTRKALGGVTVHWEVVEGGGSLRSATTQTDDNGEARNRLTLGPAPGLNTVRATVAGGAEAIFTAEAIGATGLLRIISGNGQTVPTNDPSQPLVVELVDTANQPIANATIVWTAPPVQIGSESLPNAAVESETTTTDADGRTSNIARVMLPGAALVRAAVASSDIEPVVFELNGGVANIPTLTPEQQDTSEVIDNACPALAALADRTPAQEDLYQRCLELIDNAGDNPDEVENALDQLPPQLNNTMVDAGFETLDAQFNNMGTRFQALRNPQPGGNNQFGVGVMTPTGVLPLALLPYALGSDDEPATGEVGSEFDRWGIFATGTVGRGRSDADGDNPGFDFDTSGLTFGVDYRFSDQLVAGVSLGYAKHDSEVRGDLGKLDTSGWTVNGYASWFNERNWYVDGVLSYGNNSYTLDRFIRYSITALDGNRTNIDQRARGETDGNLLGAAVSLGRDFQKGQWSLGTYLRGNFSRVELDGYDEAMLSDRAGSGLGLRYQARTLNSVTSSIGGKATYIISRDWGILMPTAQLEWEHEFRDDAQRLTATFINDPTQSLLQQSGRTVDANYFNVGIGVSALFPGGRSAYVFYEQLMGASRLSQGTLSIGGRFEF